MKKLLALLLMPAICLTAMISFADEETAYMKDDTMTLLSINVRKGDAHLLRCGDSVYLIDTGKKKHFDLLYQALQENGADHLTGVILTHSHSDHTGGLKQLMQCGITVDHVYTSAYYAPEKQDKEHPVVKALKGTGLQPEYLSAGDSLPFGTGSLQVIGPLEKMDDPDNENSNSLVLLASGGGGSVLLTGDMEFPEEQSLLNAGRIPRADVIKIGNHGEGDATSEKLLAAVDPKYAVISTNTEDEPDTPDPRVMRLLQKLGIRVLQTQHAESGVLITFRNGEIEIAVQ